MTARWAAIGVLLLVMTACSADPAGTAPAATTLLGTGPTDDLAPSQRSGSTVAPPITPSPCDPDELVFWTSRAVVEAGVADIVIRIDSLAERTCEVDITGSPALAADAEPTVWIEPGAGAEIFVVAAPSECASPPDPLVHVTLKLDGDARQIEVNALVACEYRLATLAPIGGAAGECAATDLRARLVSNPVWLLVRNESARACRLDEFTGVVVAGEPWPTAGEVLGTGPRRNARPLALAPGDIVGTQLGRSTAFGCDEVGGAQLEIAGGGAVPIEDFEGCVFLDPSSAVPYLSHPNGPLADFGTGDFDVDRVLELLDPFSEASRDT